MTLHIKATSIELTPSLKTYVEEKIGSLDRFLKRWEREGDVGVWVEVGRTTRHHLKGDVFRAEVTILMPHKKILRADAADADVRVAVNRVRDLISSEIERYKEKQGVDRRVRRAE